MKMIISAAVAAVLSTTSALALEPIEGSITYKNPNAVRLEKAPVASPVTNKFFYNGEHYEDTYLVQPDRSLKLVNRVRLSSH
ncbi:hypothetical protein [Rhizobium sp. LCM 4573]|uniref:hypothetical protein n=1 Tax=Rhizobium sp. LCM 4573 TaxID=1848291 RepID=UPI0008D990F2|nr:hypothetical protein [Rhizobium sp. LCM 4573]OHV78696.1 hypothetical protein LCM4573_26365 [Rhizobium sp. LCM 4573]